MGCPECFAMIRLSSSLTRKYLPGVDIDVRSLSLKTSHNLVHEDACMGECITFSLCAGHQQDSPHGSAWPMQIVETAGLMYCMVSYIARPAVTTPPGELI